MLHRLLSSTTTLPFRHHLRTMSTAIQTAKVQTLVAAALNILPAPSKDKDLVEEWVKKVEVEGAGDLKVRL